MANLKNLKLRIRSVKSTQKITKAMKMVSASKLRRAREAIEANRPYTEKMNEITKIVASNVDNARSVPLFYGRANLQKLLFVVVTSDRGLCGGLNSSVVRMVKKRIAEAKTQKQYVKILCIGKKGFEQLHSLKDVEVKMVDNFTYSKKLDSSHLRKLANDLMIEFSKEAFDTCSVFYNKFISAVTQIVSYKQILPLFTHDDVVEQNSNNQFEFEPEAKKMIADLVGRNMTANLLSIVLENIASEHGARMTAMENASNNAGSMIKDLNILYNRTRQSAITTELIEIISGAEAI
jgi:F-type H+-transporting ATPase subunit gamma